MATNRKHHLGELQHAIMRVLWRAGEATASAVRGALPPDQQRAPTTIATMLSKMEKKGVVQHRAQGRFFVYEPTITRQDVRRTMVSDLTRQLFEGDVTALVAHLISEEELGDADLDSLRKMIETRKRADLDASLGEAAPGGATQGGATQGGATQGGATQGGATQGEAPNRVTGSTAHESTGIGGTQ